MLDGQRQRELGPTRELSRAPYSFDDIDIVAVRSRLNLELSADYTVAKVRGYNAYFLLDSPNGLPRSGRYDPLSKVQEFPSISFLAERTSAFQDAFFLSVDRELLNSLSIFGDPSDSQIFSNSRWQPVGDQRWITFDTKEEVNAQCARVSERLLELSEPLLEGNTQEFERITEFALNAARTRDLYGRAMMYRLLAMRLTNPDHLDTFYHRFARGVFPDKSRDEVYSALDALEQAIS